MGLFSRRKSSESVDEPEVLDEAPDVDDGPVPTVSGRPESRPLDEAERGRIASGLERAAALGVDVDDLASIGSHFDEQFRAVQADPSAAGGSDVVVDTFAIAIGEHLTRHSARDWAVVTDVFGTDLGLVAARADTVVVPHNLVGARWMRGETGWIPGVVSHLVRLRPRAS
ncbi:DUF3806 domain-containing protein [Intrasporangium flavum]|uniref:DUF3806 domain-containing protein n=1 Tax=Intrasporangium flavum TaxID=1428657 RepID=UPI00096E10BB|nr:DUF3806 domain-containing protein [Intrasporangium flavum]